VLNERALAGLIEKQATRINATQNRIARIAHFPRGCLDNDARYTMCSATEPIEIAMSNGRSKDRGLAVLSDDGLARNVGARKDARVYSRILAFPLICNWNPPDAAFTPCTICEL